MMAHTPGPWVTADKMFANGIRSDVEAESGIICSCIRTVNSTKNGGSRTWDEVDANAKLIAAAPELLAALKQCRINVLPSSWAVQQYPPGSKIRRMTLTVDAAINKAEGRG